jgi:hypothetical protein
VVPNLRDKRGMVVDRDLVWGQIEDHFYWGASCVSVKELSKRADHSHRRDTQPVPPTSRLDIQFDVLRGQRLESARSNAEPCKRGRRYLGRLTIK